MPTASRAIEAPATPQPFTLLIGDDHPAVADGLRMNLSKWYRCLAPITDLDWLGDAIALTNPDGVLLDIDFHGRNALELVPALAAAFPHPAVIAYTGHSWGGFMEEARHAGCDGFLWKFAEYPDILGGIDQAIAAHRTRRSYIDRDTAPTVPLPETWPSARDGDMIIWLLRSGYSHADICEMLSVSDKVVQYHVTRERKRLASEEGPVTDWTTVRSRGIRSNAVTYNLPRWRLP